MKKEKAIEILIHQKTKLQTENLKNNTWLVQTGSYIKEFFGEESEEFLFIKKFKFYSITLDMNYDYSANNEIKKNSIAISNFLDNCIDILNQKGVYKTHKVNFISRMSEGWAIFWVSTILLVWSVFCYGIGVYQTQNKIDREKIEMKSKIDSLLRVTQSFIINTNKPANDNTTKGINSKSYKK